jgi:hypothetical protein
LYDPYFSFIDVPNTTSFVGKELEAPRVIVAVSMFDVPLLIVMTVMYFSPDFSPTATPAA